MKKTIKTLIISLVLLLSYAILSKVYAASASISANKTNVNVGETVNITVSINAAAWEIHVSGATSGNYSDVSSDGNNTSRTETLSYTPQSAGSYTVTLSGNVSDGETNATTNVGGSVTIVASNASNNANTNNNNTNTQTPEKAPNFSSTNQTVYVTADSVNVRSSYSTSSSVIGSLQKDASVTRTGVGDNGWSKISYNGGTGYVSSSYLTTTKPEEKQDDEDDDKEDDDEKNAENTLKSLEVTPEGLSPKFSASTENYTMSVGLDVEKLEIKATPTSDKAKVSITGNESFKEGNNTVKITVTAEDGETKNYTITVKKQEKSSELGLTSLKLDKYSLTPVFSKDVYEYNVTITDSTVDKLDLSAIANIEDANVEIKGNENLKEGKNTITITVTSADGEDKIVYTIYATVQTTKTAAPATTQSSNNNQTKSKLPLYIGLGIILFLIILMIIIIARNKKNDEDYSEEYDNEYDNENKDNKQDDLYNFSSKNFDIDDINSEAGQENDRAAEDIASNNIVNADINTNIPNNNAGETTPVDDKDKLKEEYLNQFNYNPYTEDNMKDINDNKVDNSYSDLFGSYKEETTDNIKTNYENKYDDYEYKPRRSKGKHSK